MAKTVRMTRGKFDGIQAVADQHGIISAAAMDQRGSLKKMISKAKGSPASDAELTEFKVIGTRFLTQYASAILMDPEYGLDAVRAKAPGAGVLLAYEKTGYDATVPGRLPDLLPNWSVGRLMAAGADAIKILLYYNPDDPDSINQIKHAFIERVGAECAAYDVPFFLEPICYSTAVPDDQSLEFARLKPDLVTRYMTEFSKPQYGVDILKVEVPVNVKYVEGSPAYAGTRAYTEGEAKTLFKKAAAVARKPFIYLSAGVTDEVFRATLELAADAGVGFAGVLCGRATWQDGVPAYGQGGAAGLEAWLKDRGRRNLEMLNAVLRKGARPWYDFYGGLGSLEIVDGPASLVDRSALRTVYGGATK
ncbi:MAG TPA: tagatose 1,6-diphosphate aldolase [Methylomirabilota bacterium]|nr:tagatose 1,6-diphosphate aldolase [Methylomirabilota bacterium]